MIGLMEILLIGATLLVPVLIVFLFFKGAQILLKIQKDVENISQELRNRNISSSPPNTID
ncbi:hypothetical protein [Corynebacterium sp. ES2715-CONJ3]|uniref:hypothetical protein n=1 Tax=Corynebacterium sp. ES2715-CONJ3 TaxID=2974028 RepID=UPI002166C35C|nr:hypothetical protein [Corynebacterium sp. ES2715-CONJ3]MCS4492044.1 hypothetical protein [Corynebacterium sp. ES2715-CONJ3]